MELKIALAGNPNCGKTTLFNALTGSNQYVGNWPGVTVEKKEGRLKGQKDVIIQDLPGIYSLSPYTLEETVARAYLVNEKPDAILNIVDGTNMERNLYLTTQLIELGLPVVVAVNMMDLVRKNGDQIDLEKLSADLGCPVVGISAREGKEMDALMGTVLSAAQAGEGQRVPAPLADLLRAARTGDEAEREEAEAAGRYDFITQVVAGTVKKARAARSLTTSDKIDRIVTNRILALPIFVAVMFLVYALAMGTSIADGGFSIGTFATDWANDVLGGEWLVEGSRTLLEGWGVSEWLTGLVSDGILAGVGAVLGFVPQMLVLFLLLSILEDCGYMARIAFIMDRIFRRFGLSGKSFIPMLVATGCGVPGIMASRTIEQDRDRKMTIMTTCFMPCGAKAPIIALFAGAIFGHSPLVAASAYFIGIGSVILSGIMLKKFKAFAGDPAPFVMELPAYHIPNPGNVFRATWERGWSFIKRAGTVILLSAILIWFLQSFGFTAGGFGMVADSADSLLAAIGGAIAFIFAPLGFGTWQATVATITGLVAKEEDVGTMGVLYQGNLSQQIALHFTPITTYSFMLFNLLCAPCFAAIGAIKREMNNWKWTLAAVGYMCLWAYVVALITYQIGGLMAGEVTFGLGTVAALACIAAILYLLCRKGYQEERETGRPTLARAGRA